MQNVLSLSIMARTPRLHETKTRLASTLGAEGALAAHIELVEDTLARLSHLRQIDTSLWVTQVDSTTRAWSARYGVALKLQPQGDLGEKMQHVLTHALGSGYAHACLVGTDCPCIDEAYVDAAFDCLQNNDVVVGPAADGGYGLIGVSRVCQGLFCGVQWGSAEVFAQTLLRASREKQSVGILDVIWDVDTPEDWLRYLKWKAARG